MTDVIVMKTCTTCKQQKPEERFKRRNDRKEDSKNKFRNQCRKCESHYNSKRKIQKKKQDLNYYWKVRANGADDAAYRAKKRQGLTAGKLNHIELMNLYESDQFCYYCRIEINKEDCEIEHTIPLSRGGDHVISNITICCKDCNQLKGTRTEEEFKKFLEEYVNRLIRAAK